MTKLNSPITTIPGIGSVIGATILGELGDISRFSNASKIVAYAGLDSVVSQSGNYEAKSMSISKRGSSYLRKVLFQAALIAEFCDPVFSDYYQKKIAQGKHHLVATNAVARKLCYTIFTVLTKNEAYKIQQLKGKYTTFLELFIQLFLCCKFFKRKIPKKFFILPIDF